MGKLNRFEYNCSVMKRDGGLVRCQNCGQITGFIYERNHRYIKYLFICKCEADGKAELSRGEKPELKYPHRMVYQKGNIHICPNCGRELFWVKKDAILNYTFNVVCKCSVEYDTKYFIKNL